MTTPSLSDFLTHRRADLLRKIEGCRVELAEYEKELGDIEKAGAALAISFSDVACVISSIRDDPYLPETRVEKRNPEMTMKESALEILRECTGGLTTNDILDVMNDRLKTSYPRSSLSPQLSRLKGEGKVFRENGRWMLSTT